MKLKKIAAIISAAALTLTLTGCGNNSEFSNAFANNPQNGQSGGTHLNPFQSKPAVQLPDIPVNDASAFKYKFDSNLGGMVITDYKLQSPKVHIPEKLENEKVVKVDFSGVSKDITHIIMPDSVQEFGFSDQIIGVLQFVNIPNSVTEISGLAFCGCTGLTSITIPNSVTKISELAFYKCQNIKVTYKGKTYDYYHTLELYDAINLGESGMQIEKGVLIRVSRDLTEVIIPDNVTEILEHAFQGNKNIKATYKGKTYDYEHIEDLYTAINSN